MNCFIATMALWCVFGATIGGSILSGMLLSIGMTDSQIGAVMSLSLIFLPMQLLGSILQRRFFHRKKFWMVLAVCHYSAFLAIALLVASWGRLNQATAVGLFMGFFALAQIASQLQGATVLAWIGELVPFRESHRFWTRRTAVQIVASVLAGIGMGLLADHFGREKSSTYAFLLGVGLIFGYLSFITQAIPPDPEREEKPFHFHLGEFLGTLWKESNFRYLSGFFAIQSIGNWVMSAFTFVYLQRDMEFSQTDIQILLAMSSLVSFVSGYLFTAFGNRYGRKPLLMICSVLKFGEFLLWGTLTPGNNWLDHSMIDFLNLIHIPTGGITPGLLGAAPVFLLGGFVNMGLNSGQLSLLTTEGNKENQSFLIAFFFTLTGLAGAAAAFASGFLFEFFRTFELLTRFQLTAFNGLALVGSVFFLICLVSLAPFRELGAAPAGKVVRSFLSHNPFRAVFQAHVLASPLEESRRAETLGSAGSGLADNEFLLGLRSPSSMVRMRTLLHLATMDSDELDPAITDELQQLLQSKTLSVRPLAAMTLAKHNVTQAEDALIASFNDRDPDFVNTTIYCAGLLHLEKAREPLRAILLSPAREFSRSAAAEALSRFGDYHDAELIFTAYLSESDWILSRQCLLSLLRTMTPPPHHVMRLFEEEEKTPGARIEQELLLLAGRPSLGLSAEVLTGMFSAGEYTTLLAKVLVAELSDEILPGAMNDEHFLLERFLPGGRFRDKFLQGEDLRANALRLQLRFWQLLRREGSDPDRFKLLGALILARLQLEQPNA
ncbi:MAG: MFS transporter [Victivallaceae bacterium]|nr:MFS transporter [Victivallaceae bacterium]